ncbi:MAG: flagellar basal body-associated FliL family protein [Pseudomonadota bacterium]
MVDVSEAEPEEEAPKKGGKGLMVALIGAVVAGGAGFGVASMGFLDALVAPKEEKKVEVKADFVFVPLDPLVISLGPTARARTLRFAAQLEVEPDAKDAVADMSPRILDVLNSYLRAVDESELADPAALALLRAQMLRRIQTVIGDGIVRDLLILEFVLN